MSPQWRTYEVIVSLRACADFIEKDMRWQVEQALERGDFDGTVRKRHKGQFGAITVKQRARVEAAERVKARKEAE